MYGFFCYKNDCSHFERRIWIMKIYFIGILALALLAGCTGNKVKRESKQDTDSIHMHEKVIDSIPLPELPVVRPKIKPINMRDSLKTVPDQGAVIQKRYKGRIPALKAEIQDADSITEMITYPGYDPEEVMSYTLLLYYQSVPDSGVYRLDAVHANKEADHQTYVSTGKEFLKRGIPGDETAMIYEFIPGDGSRSFCFLATGDSLTLLDYNLQKGPEYLNYTLILEQ